MRQRQKLLAVATTVAVLGGGVAAADSGVFHAGPAGNGTAVTPNGWFLTPAGQQTKLGDRPFGSALSPDGRSLLISNDGQSTQSLMVLDPARHTVRQTISYPAGEALFVGLAYSPDGRHVYASGGGNNKIRMYDVAADGRLTERDPIALPTTDGTAATVNHFPAGIAVAPDGGTLYVADELSDSLAVISLADRRVTFIPAGHNPYGVAVSGNGRTAYVSNQGANTVTPVDTVTRAAMPAITVGTHPNALALHPKRSELYVANGDSDTVSVIDTRGNTVVRTIDLAPYPGAPVGASPNAVAVSPNGRTLYVANAGDNDIAAVTLAHHRQPGEDTDGATGPAPDAPTPDAETPDAAVPDDGGAIAADRVSGLIPTGWYPTAVQVSRTGREIYVANAKGLGAGPNPDGPNPYTDTARRGTPAFAAQYIGSMIVGSLSTVPTPGRDQLTRYTQQVARNNGTDQGGAVRGGPSSVIPRRPGGPSPIKHVIYVVKENRTYDQILGSLGKGDGDPALNLFDDDSAPNIRSLARQFVTLDNFYADAEVSADGWNWSTAATANTYVQKTWPANYADAPGRNHPYDYEGGNLATAPGRATDNSYIWDRLDTAGIGYRNYGFWRFGLGPVAPTAPKLAASTDLAYPGYALDTTDQTRVGEWEREFAQYEATRTLPAVQFVRLPNDHTQGTKAGAPTPKAMVADNDLAVGRLVQAVSASPDWASTAIFVVEDDAQAGPDHVDAHRTEALVISPYTQHATVDHTFYSTVAMLRTMELLAGIGPLTQFDAAARPMLTSFSTEPNLAPYLARTPRQPLDELNTATAPMAAQSAAMDFTDADKANEQVLNEAVWRSVKGAGAAMPAPRHHMIKGTSGDPDGDD